MSPSDRSDVDRRTRVVNGFLTEIGFTEWCRSLDCLLMLQSRMGMLQRTNGSRSSGPPGTHRPLRLASGQKE